LKNYHYRIEDDVLFLKFRDRLSLDTVQSLFGDLDRDDKYVDGKIRGALVDLTEVASLLTMPVDYKIYSERIKKDKARGIVDDDTKLAIIVRKLGHEIPIKLLSLVAERLGSTYKSFRTRSSAVAFLNIEQDDYPFLIPLENQEGYYLNDDK